MHCKKLNLQVLNFFIKDFNLEANQIDKIDSTLLKYNQIIDVNQIHIALLKRNNLKKEALDIASLEANETFVHMVFQCIYEQFV